MPTQKLFLDNTGLTLLLDELGQYLKSKLDILTFDTTPTTNSTNPVTSGGVKIALDGKQDTLVSGTNIKTVNGNSLLGSGNLKIDNIVEYDHESELLEDYLQPHGTIGYAGDELTWYIFDGNEAHWLRLDNVPLQLKTINNNSLLGSGNIEITASDIEQRNGDTVQDSLDALTNSKQDRLVSGTNIKTINTKSLVGSGDVVLEATDINVTNDDTNNLWTSGDPVEDALDALSGAVANKQANLVSGTNIKTVNNNSLLGNGNVQVGDITGEELETEIEELESTLITDALRKSEQVLLPAEKTQVLTNLGIADVAKESNLKTVNGASLIGNGNIEIVSVNAGDINVMQGTGNSQTDVMSLKAVSEEVQRITEEEVDIILLLGIQKLPDGYERVQWIDIKNNQIQLSSIGYIKDNNWRFVGSFYVIQRLNQTNNCWILFLVTNNNYANYCLYMPGNYNGFGLRGGNTVEIDYAPTELINCWHNFDISYNKISIDNIEYNTQHRTGNFDNWYLNLGYDTSKITYRIGLLQAYHNDELVGYFVPCINSLELYGFYDTINNEWFSAASITGGEVELSDTNNKVVTGDTLQTLSTYVSQQIGDSEYKLMSQKVITEELDSASRSYKTFTHVGGELCYFSLNDFPQFSPIDCDGISIALDGDTKDYSSYTSSWIMILNKGGSVSSTNPFFGIVYSWGAFFVGLLQSVFSNRIYNGLGASSSALRSYAHLVITFSFTTGELCLYKNGSLFLSVIPENFDEELFRSKLQEMTHLGIILPTNATYNLYTASAVGIFGHVLTASEVTTIYGGGCESTKGIIVPELYKAYNIKPHIITEYDITGHNWTTFYTVTKETNGDRIITMKSGLTNLNFALVGIKGDFCSRNRREFDFTILNGSILFTNCVINNSNGNGAVTIYDSEGTNVTTQTLGSGTYHAVIYHANLSSPVNDTYLNGRYNFTAAENTSIRIHSLYKVTELGAALICSYENYRGKFWEQQDGSKIPTNPKSGYFARDTITYYDVYKGQTVIYSSSLLPQFNGLMAVDTTNNKVYVGILNVNGGTWKQINNS